MKLFVAVLAVIVLAFILIGVRYAVAFGDDFVFVTVEESSTSALSSWPLLWDKTPQAFIDPKTEILEIPIKVNLAAVSLAVYYTAFSQGVEFADRLVFSRTGRNAIGLEAPLSVMSRDWEGNEVNLVDNEARVLRGDLKITKTKPDGTVHLIYGSERIVLGPGESWAELTLKTPDGTVQVDTEEWGERLTSAFQNQWPATRLAVANLGLWSKKRVQAGAIP